MNSGSALVATPDERLHVRVGLIGLGAIGGQFVDLVRADPECSIDVVAALVRDTTRKRSTDVPQVESLEALLAHGVDIVAEAGGHAALREFAPVCLAAGVPLVALSIGALADSGFEQEVRTAAAAGHVQLTLASGAVGCLDLLASAAEGGLEQVLHTILKPPTAFGLDPTAGGEIFHGTARQAATDYPQNANVAAAIALAGVGLDRSEVSIVADPTITANCHQIEMRGTFGRCSVTIEGKPSRDNPRTAAVVPMSLKHSLERRHATVVIG